MLPVNASEVLFEEDWQKAFEGCDTTASFIRMTLRERTERTEADRSIADEAVPLPAKSRRRYFILIQVIVLGGLLIYMLSWLIRDFKGAEPVLNAGFILRCLIFVFTIYIFISRGRDLLRQRVKGNKKK